jgi:hypothetical protein
MNMRIIFLAAVLLLVIPGVAAADLSLSGPSSIIAGNDFVLAVSGGDSFETVTLSLISGNRPDLSLLPGQSGVSGTVSSARIELDAFGSARVEYTTTSGGEVSSCRFTVSDGESSDSATVRVTRGTVSATAVPERPPQQNSHAIGSTVPLAGAAPGKSYVYLFLTGPNLPAQGVRLDNPSVPAVTGESGTFVRRAVDSSGMWSYSWKTSGRLDTGTYTVFAVDQPVNRYSLSDTSYATYPVTLGRASVTAGVSTNPSVTLPVPDTATATIVPDKTPEPVKTPEPEEPQKSFWDMLSDWFGWLTGGL